MARFFGGVQGRRGPATRLGDSKSGLHVFAAGWFSGVDVKAEPDYDFPERDVFYVYADSGSRQGEPRRRLIARVEWNEDMTPRVVLLGKDGEPVTGYNVED